MTQDGDILISLDIAHAEASPLAQAYTRWWETPRAERRHPVLARIAAGLVRVANRLAPALAPEAAPSEAMNGRITAARAAGQP
jgi:hypothetical protein